ncbi:MAG: LytTR family transcriptional regulator DNA-binding domain-containing protein [Saprospiraceae bacterium]|nr:LytTR family transcriptional regulator DNA-binding domain-containing protein [Saprospiraceae bacterium]
MFFRIHQSTIINISFLKRVYKDRGDFVELADSTKIKIARRRKEEFINIFK